jgi:hypothetical protein
MDAAVDKTPDNAPDMNRHGRLMKQYRKADDGWRDRFEAGAHDLAFAVGTSQWDDREKAERDAEGRPALTINKMMKFINNVNGDQKQNRPEGKVFPVDGEGDVATAEVLQDIVRHIEYKSSADAVYDTGFTQCLAGSIGFWRVLSEYENENTFEQGLRIKKIRNQFTVLFDPDAKDPNYTDARYVFIIDKIAKERFKAEYPKASLHNFDARYINIDNTDWFHGEYIRIAECYYKKTKKKTMALLNTGETVELKGDYNKKFIEEQGLEIVQTREAEYDEIYWVKMNGHEVIAGPEKQPGKFLPVVPIPGDEIDVQGISHMFSLIRHAKDSQRMLNYFHSSAVEAMALQGNDPYLVTPKMIAGHQQEWRESPRRSRIARQYNYDPIAGKPERKPPPTVPTGAFAEMDKFDKEIHDTIGMYAPSFGGQSNERSNSALLTKQRASDKGIFNFFDNHARAIAHTARILVDLIPHYYDTERIINIMGDDDKIRQVEINKVERNPLTLEDEVVNDLSNAGEYDVVTKSGPSYETKRQQTAEFLMQFVQFAPQTAPRLFPMIAKNLDAPGAAEVADLLIGDMEAQMQQSGPQGQGAAPSAPQQQLLPMG